jgi:DNA repair photolyase
VYGKFEKSFEGFRDFRRRFKSERDFEKIEVAIEDGKVKGICRKHQEEFIAKAIKHKHPLRIGSVSEPFGLPLEKEYGDTYRVLEILISHNYPFVVCTKSPLVASKRYVNLLRSANERAAVQISLISLNQDLLKFLESRRGGVTPSAESRLNALRKLSDEGIFTICRIQPLIPQVTEYGMQDLIFALAEASVKHVIVEFLWLPIGHARDMGLKLKSVFDAYYASGGRVGDELRKYGNNIFIYYRSFKDVVIDYGRIFYSKKKMLQLMPKFAVMVSEANKEYNANMTFGSGNEETTFLNMTDNCCGIDRLRPFSKYPKCTGQTVLGLARKKGSATISEMTRYYNPYVDKFVELWYEKGKRGYFLEDRVFKLRAKETDGEVEYIYDESAVPDG